MKGYVIPPSGGSWYSESSVVWTLAGRVSEAIRVCQRPYHTRFRISRSSTWRDDVTLFSHDIFLPKLLHKIKEHACDFWWFAASSAIDQITTSANMFSTLKCSWHIVLLFLPHYERKSPLYFYIVIKSVLLTNLLRSKLSKLQYKTSFVVSISCLNLKPSRPLKSYFCFETATHRTVPNELRKSVTFSDVFRENDCFSATGYVK